MLILDRKPGQKIMIDDDIEIVIAGVRGHAVKVGIQADRSHIIHREEIYQEIQKEKLIKALEEEQNKILEAGNA